MNKRKPRVRRVIYEKLKCFLQVDLRAIPLFLFQLARFEERE